MVYEHQTRCMIQIFGGVMFFETGVVMAQGGLLLGSAVILCCTLVSTLTVFSLSALATNGVIPGGGTYYMLSRSLGPKFGAAVGLLLALSESFQVSLYVSNFAKGMSLQFPSAPWLSEDASFGQRVLVMGVILVVVAIVTINGIFFVVRLQVLMLVVVALLSIVMSIVIGSLVPGPTDVEQGVFRPSPVRVELNLLPPDQSNRRLFNDLLHRFFPATTGITAGTTVFGQLRVT